MATMDIIPVTLSILAYMLFIYLLLKSDKGYDNTDNTDNTNSNPPADYNYTTEETTKVEINKHFADLEIGNQAMIVLLLLDDFNFTTQDQKERVNTLKYSLRQLRPLDPKDK